MQQHPIVTRLRFIGLFIGGLLFVAMVYQSGRNVSNPVALKGKPNLQVVATFDAPGGLMANGNTMANQAAAVALVQQSDVPNDPTDVTLSSKNQGKSALAHAAQAATTLPVQANQAAVQAVASAKVKD